MFKKGLPNAATVARIKAAHTEGKTNEAISQEVNWSPNVVQSALNGKYDTKPEARSTNAASPAPPPPPTPQSAGDRLLEVLRGFIQDEVKKTLRSV